jgi:hypothetical protein
MPVKASIEARVSKPIAEVVKTRYWTWWIDGPASYCPCRFESLKSFKLFHLCERTGARVQAGPGARLATPLATPHRTMAQATPALIHFAGTLEIFLPQKSRGVRPRRVLSRAIYYKPPPRWPSTSLMPGIRLPHVHEELQRASPARCGGECSTRPFRLASRSSPWRVAPALHDGRDGRPREEGDRSRRRGARAGWSRWRRPNGRCWGNGGKPRPHTGPYVRSACFGQ